VKYGYLKSGGECAQTMLCPRYGNRASLMGKEEAVSASCVNTGIGSQVHMSQG
jgi:hypothetical protein